MSRMFARAKYFDSDISRWDVSKVRDMRGMFLGATSFNGDLSKWDVSSVNDMHGMFLGATLFKRNLCGAAWVHSTAKKDSMFEGSPGSISSSVCTIKTAAKFSPETKDELKDAVLAHLQVSKPAPKRGGGITPPRPPMKDWDVSRITDMSGLFDSGSIYFNEDISKWDVSRVTDMSSMFNGALSFKRDISKWDVSRVTDMRGMFWGATAFVADVSKWDVSKVEDMSGMFSDVSLFNCDISKWDVSRVNDMSGMFRNAISFNRDLSKWDVSRVTDMRAMFMSATLFTQKLSGDAWVHSKAHEDLMFEGGLIICLSLLLLSIACTKRNQFSSHSFNESR